MDSSLKDGLAVYSNNKPKPFLEPKYWNHRGIRDEEWEAIL